MSIYRLDNRSRFRARYLNDPIDQLQQMNKARFNVFGNASGAYNLGGSIFFESVYEKTDWAAQCPGMALEISVGLNAFEYIFLNREAIPTWGTSISTTREASNRAEDVRYNARGNAWAAGLEANGWGGIDLTGVTTEQFLTGGGYEFDSEESQGWFTDDVLGPYDPVTNPYPGGTEAGYTFITLDNWTHNDFFFCPSPHAANHYFMGNPLNGVYWGTKANGGGRLTLYPFDPEGLPGGGNHVSWGTGSAEFNVGTQAAAFGHILRSLPDGAVITKVLIPVKLSSFTVDDWTIETVVTWNQAEYDLGHNPWVFTSTPGGAGITSSGSVGFSFMGRYPTGTQTIDGRVKRVTGWDFIGSSSGGTVTSDEWAVVDLTDICNQYVTTIRKQKKFFEFAIFPSGGGIGSGSGGWLEGLAQKPPYALELNPNWNTIGAPRNQYKNHGWFFDETDDPYDDSGLYLPFESGGSVSWGGVLFGEGVIEWQLPATENRRAVTYRNMIRGDTPITV